MSGSSCSEKEDIEKVTLSRFKAYMREEKGINIEDTRRGNPPEPDFICLLNGEELGIECTTTFRDDVEAREILGRDRHDDRDEDFRRQRRQSPLNVDIPAFLNGVIKDKSSKKYSINRVWLVIHSGARNWRKENFKHYEREIFIPQDHPFEGIWLICDPRGDTGIIQLFLKEGLTQPT